LLIPVTRHADAGESPCEREVLRQRAVEVAEGAMDEVTPKISSSRISGLCVSGRVVRKQEVALERQ
jgi:hypothetical protein